MPFPDHSTNPFAGEILLEVAGTFFGTRKHIEEMIALVHDSAKRLQRQSRQVDHRAATLNYLLLHPVNSRKFFGIANVDYKAFAVDGPPTNDGLPPNKPSGWTVKRKYINLVLEAYAALQTAVSLYQTGPPDDDGDVRPSLPEDAYYNLLVEMCRLINAKITALNQGMTPSATMSYVKTLDAEGRSKARIAGGASGEYAQSIDQKLRFDRIRFTDLGLKSYPLLPPLNPMRAKITAFCKTLFKTNTPEVRRVTLDLCNRIQTAYRPQA